MPWFIREYTIYKLDKSALKNLYLYLLVDLVSTQPPV
jgi:hypothetical protein